MGVIVGDVFITGSEVIEAGSYKAGAVLGKVTDSGTVKLCAKKNGDSDVTDGSQNPYAILLEDVNTDTNKNVPVLLLGEVDKSQLSFGDGWDLNDIVRALRDVSIFAKGVING